MRSEERTLLYLPVQTNSKLACNCSLSLAEGEQQDRLVAKLAAIRRLLDLGLTVEQVAQALKLDVKTVKQAVPKQP